ncbi:MAG: 2,3-diketo-5-methylthio-phosphopentane phosphatase [Firmicutes bacterium]|nr:2,3-diketo-5-methylthio-phosphopentane phosphatase [Bacillota bacterium]
MLECFLAIDFDGTISEVDVTDAVLSKFAGAEWLEIEKRWSNGEIGSRQCLSEQIELIGADLETVLKFVDTVRIDSEFARFVTFVRSVGLAHAIISDGFCVFIRRILANAGIIGVPVFANNLKEQSGKWKTFYVNSFPGCPAGTCKCAVVERLRTNLPVVLIGDGRSDFCLADKADFIFAKGKLSEYCKERNLPYLEYKDFSDVTQNLLQLTEKVLRQMKYNIG